MSKEYEQPDYLEGKKRPWEAGFEKEEAEQKAEHRVRKGDRADAIKDTVASELEKAGHGKNSKRSEG